MATEAVDLRTSRSRLNALWGIMSRNPDVEEAYVALLAAIRLSPAFAEGSTLLISSTEPGEGKTTVAASLAITASRAGQNILLIEGDLRQSALASAIGGTNAIGLTEVLLGEASAADAIIQVTNASTTGQICVMAPGRKSSIYLPAVDWAKARETFKAIAQDFSAVLLDSPPILAANDALLLAGLADAALLVIGTGKADVDEVRRAKEQLDRVGIPIVGAVLNRFEPKAHGPSTQPYRGYGRAQT